MKLWARVSCCFFDSQCTLKVFCSVLVVGMEAIWKVQVEDFPAFIVVDDKGNDFFKEWQVE